MSIIGTANPEVTAAQTITIPPWVIYLGIFVLVLIAIAILYYIFNSARKTKQKKLQLQIDTLEATKNSLLASQIEALLAKIRSFEQTERIVSKHKNWTVEWIDARQALEGAVTDGLISLEDVLERNKFKEFPDKFAEVNTLITDTETKIKTIEEEINTFVTNESYIHGQYEAVKDALKQVAQLFYANKTSLSPYTERLQERIEELNKELYHVLGLMDTEDKKDVEEHLVALKDEILLQYNLIKKIPDATALNTKVLQPQLFALNRAYKEMIDQDFLFQGLNLDTRIDKLHDQVAEVQNLTDTFQLDFIETKGVYIRKQIEEIHQILINERNAKVDVVSMLENLNQKMNRLRFDKEDFLDIWNKLVKRYETTKEQNNHVDAFSAQVLSAETKMILFNNQFEKNQEAYVVLLNELKMFDQQLNDLQYTLSKLKKTVDTIKEDEIYIHAQYKQLRYMYHRSRRKISQLPVELLPDDYLMKNEEAQAALNDIKVNLENDVLDVKRLTELIEIAQHLAIRFYKDTNMLIKAAAFAEKAIIYSNRYRFDKNVQRHLAKAEYLYRQGEYTEALDISLTTLEAVEPGIYETLLQAYETAVAKETER